MPIPDPVAAAARGILRALESGIPVLKVGNDEHPIVLTRKRRGEEIDDPDCDELYEALADGVYRRFPMTRGDEKGWKWLFLCEASEGDLAAFLGDEIASLGHVDRESIPLDAAWQKMQWEDAKKRQLGRAEWRAEQNRTAAEEMAAHVFSDDADVLECLRDRLRRAIGTDAELRDTFALAVCDIAEGRADEARARVADYMAERQPQWTAPAAAPARGM